MVFASRIITLPKSVEAKDEDASTDTSRTVALIVSLLVLAFLLGLCITYCICKNFVAKKSSEYPGFVHEHEMVQGGYSSSEKTITMNGTLT